MGVHALTAVNAGGASLVHEGLEVAKVAVAENAGEVAARPLLVTGVVDAAWLLEGRGRAGCEFGGHGSTRCELMKL
jgi:hypothetical protein